MNKKIMLTTLLIVAMMTPMANAYYYFPNDEWVKQNAITGLLSEHTELSGLNFTATIVGGWEYHYGAPWHKHVVITATYGYNDTGSILWEGRSYSCGGIYTITYENTEPEPKPIYTFNSGGILVDFSNTQLYWNGVAWKSPVRTFYDMGCESVDRQVEVTIVTGGSVFHRVKTLPAMKSMVVVDYPYNWDGVVVTVQIDGVTYYPN